MNASWAGADHGRRSVAQLVYARASELTLGLERGPERPGGYAVDLEASRSRGLADSGLILGILQLVHWAPPVEQRCWGDPGVQGGPDGWRILDARAEANRWQQGPAVCLGRKRPGRAEQALEMLRVMCRVLPVDQSCRDDPGAQDGLDDLGARDALDERQHWKEQARAVEREPREAARRPHALQREPLFSPGALFGSPPAGRRP